MLQLYYGWVENLDHRIARINRKFINNDMYIYPYTSLGYESMKKEQLKVVSAINKQCVLIACSLEDGIKICLSVHLREFFGDCRLPQ